MTDDQTPPETPSPWSREGARLTGAGDVVAGGRPLDKLGDQGVVGSGDQGVLGSGGQTMVGSGDRTVVGLGNEGAVGSGTGMVAEPVEATSPRTMAGPAEAAGSPFDRLKDRRMVGSGDQRVVGSGNRTVVGSGNQGTVGSGTGMVAEPVEVTTTVPAPVTRSGATAAPVPGRGTWRATAGRILPGQLLGVVVGLGLGYVATAVLTLLALGGMVLAPALRRLVVGIAGQLGPVDPYSGIGGLASTVCQLVGLSLGGRLHAPDSAFATSLAAWLTLPVVSVLLVVGVGVHLGVRVGVSRRGTTTRLGLLPGALIAGFLGAVVVLMVTRLGAFGSGDLAVHAASGSLFATAWPLFCLAVWTGSVRGTGQAVLDGHPLLDELRRGLGVVGRHLLVFGLVVTILGGLSGLITVALDDGLGAVAGEVLAAPLMDGNVLAALLALGTGGSLRATGLAGVGRSVTTLTDLPTAVMVVVVLALLVASVLAGLARAAARRLGGASRRSTVMSWALLPLLFGLVGVVTLANGLHIGARSFLGGSVDAGYAPTGMTVVGMVLQGVFVELVARVAARTGWTPTSRWLGAPRDTSFRQAQGPVAGQAQGLVAGEAQGPVAGQVQGPVAGQVQGPVAEPVEATSGAGEVPSTGSGTGSAGSGTGSASAGTAGVGSSVWSVGSGAEDGATPAALLDGGAGSRVVAARFREDGTSEERGRTGRDVAPDGLGPSFAGPVGAAGEVPSTGSRTGSAGSGTGGVGPGSGAATVTPRRNHRRLLIVLACVLAVLAALGIVATQVAHRMESTTYGPQKQAEAVMDALVAGDVDRVLQLAPQTGIQGPLVSTAAYAKATERPSRYSVTDVRTEGDTSTVSVVASLGTRDVPMTLGLQRTGRHLGLVDTWRVTDLPLVDMTLAVPAGTTSVLVDGQSAPVQPDSSTGQRQVTLTALPATYTLALPAISRYLVAPTVTRQVVPSGAVGIAQLGYKAAGTLASAVDAQLRKVIAQCAAQTVLAPPGCPWALEQAPQDQVRNIHWQVVRQPSAIVQQTDDPRVWQLQTRSTGLARINFEAADMTVTPVTWRQGTMDVDFGSDGAVTLSGDTVTVTLR